MQFSRHRQLEKSQDCPKVLKSWKLEFKLRFGTAKIAPLKVELLSAMIFFCRTKLSTEHLLTVFKEISYSCKKAKCNMVTGYMGQSICCCKHAHMSVCCVWWQSVGAEGSDVFCCCCGKSSLKRCEPPRDVGGIFASFTSAERGSAVRAMSPSGETAGC